MSYVLTCLSIQFMVRLTCFVGCYSRPLCGGGDAQRDGPRHGVRLVPVLRVPLLPHAGIQLLRQRGASVYRCRVPALCSTAVLSLRLVAGTFAALCFFSCDVAALCVSTLF